MRIARFYCPFHLAVQESFVLPSNLHQHAVRVLRLKIGEPLILFNGKGGEYHARLIDCAKRRSRIQIDSFNPIERESTLQSTLALSLIKPDKMDYALQKAVELGVSVIQPLITERSVVRINKVRLNKKMRHWQAVIQSACEQSGRTRLAQLSTPLTLVDFLAQKSPDDLGLLLSPQANLKLTQITYKEYQKVITLIGPEGGFSDKEIDGCKRSNCLSIGLGHRILRAETAASSVLTIIQTLWGDLS